MFKFNNYSNKKKSKQIIHPLVNTNNMSKIINSNKIIHIFISGIIRPNINYLNFLSAKIKYLFSSFNIKLYLLTWDNQNINKENIIGFDYIFFEPEPTDEYIYNNITNKTKQQIQLKGEIDNWTPRIYKQFYSIRKIIEHIQSNNIYIPDDDIVIRIRPDLYFYDYQINTMNIILNSFNTNIYYFCPRYETALSSCDWFAIASYNIFKKILYIKDDKTYNELIKNIWNAEDIILYNIKNNNIKSFSLNNNIQLRICRKFTSENELNLHHYK